MTAQIVERPSDGQFDEAAAALKLLSDPTRLRVVWALLHGEHAVGELAEHVGANPAAVSQHLAKLRLSGLVRSYRRGNQVIYSIRNSHLASLVEEALSHAEHVVRGIADHGPAPTAERVGGQHA